MNFDRGTNPNALSRLLPVGSLVEEGHWHFDRFKDLTMDKALIGEHYYSDKAPLTSVLVLPFYYLGQKLMGWRSVNFPHPALFISGNLLCGLLPFLIWLFLLARRCAWPWERYWVILFTTFPVAYVGTVFGHLWAGVFLVVAWHAAERKNPWVCALGLGLCFLTEYPMLVLWPFVGLRLALRGKKFLLGVKDLMAFGLPLALCVGLALAYNFALSGQALKMPYAFVNDPAFAHAKLHYGFRLPSVKAMWALLWGTKRGAFFYAPLLFVLAWVAAKDKVWKKWESADWLLAFAFFGFLIFLSSYAMWWGGWSYGPRHLIPLFMLLSYGYGPWLASVPLPRRAWRIAAFCGLASIIMANLTVGFMIPDHLNYPWIDPFLKHLQAGRWNENNLWLKVLATWYR